MGPDLLDDADHVGVCVSAVHLELRNEAVDLVQNQTRRDVLLPRLAEHSDCLRPDAFHHLSQHSRVNSSQPSHQRSHHAHVDLGEAV
eukprot:1106889-Rhodomonas_salina.2